MKTVYENGYKTFLVSYPFSQLTPENVYQSSENVPFCYWTEITIALKDVLQENVYEVYRSSGCGELSPSACPGVGNRLPRKKKVANPWGFAREAW